MATEFVVTPAGSTEDLYLKCATVSPSKAGKTYSSLAIATGFTDVLGGNVVGFDTEFKRMQFYKDIFKFDHIPIQAPYTVQKYIDAIDYAEEHEYTVMVIDSLTPMWTGEGGLLSLQHTKAKHSGNSFTAWGDVTPLYNEFVDRLSAAQIHMICTMRTKVEYILEKIGDTSTVRKLGTKPVQREGLDYEFDVIFNIDRKTHIATIETRAFGQQMRDLDGQEILPTPELGADLCKWLNGTEEPIKRVKVKPPAKQKKQDIPDELKGETEEDLF